ncbi:MAG TPA: choice-of-anchor D domain-containing protein [Streptosporangiaceae bacterium]
MRQHHVTCPARTQRRSLLLRGFLAVSLVVTAAAAGAGLLPRLPVTAVHADEVTASQNDLRTGWDPAEPNLAPVSDGGPVGGSDFGQLFKTHLNGQIYAQPIVVGNTLVVATETNHVYGLNAVTGAVEWSDSLGKPEPYTGTGCADIAPDVGITGAPVYDPATGAVYLVAVVDDGPSVSQPHVYTYALNAATGKVLPGWPAAIQGSPVNAPGDSFNPLAERERPGLLLLGDSVYMAFGSYCDYLPYAGYVAGVNTSTRHVTLWTDEAGLTDNQGGIWQGGSGLMSDGPGRILVSTGNGVSPPAGPGSSPPPELGDAVVRLDVASNGTLSAGDFFSPADAPTLDAQDLDLGSGGPVGLPFGTPADPDLLVQAGKDGRVLLLNRDNLGGRAQGSGGTDDVVAQAGPFGGEWGQPAAFGPDGSVTATGSDDYVYYVGRGDVMRYLQFGADSSGTPTLTDVADSSTTFGYTSGSPVVTSNGNDPASAVVWEVYSAGGGGATGTLDAFAAVPPSGCATPCSMAPIWSAPIGTAAKFTIPVTDSGRVYVGTRGGNVLAFGSPAAAPLTAAPVSFGYVPVGRARTLPVTLTAAGPVTVIGVSAAQPAGSAPFTVTSVAVDGQAAKFPVALGAGSKLTARLSYRPAEPGGVTGAVQVATQAANFPLISVSLTGQGTVPGLHPSVPAVMFRRVAEGLSPAQTIMLTNDSGARERIRATSPPASPFAATLPARGRFIQPGQSVAVTIGYRSATTGTRTSSFSITTSDGHRLTVGLMGSGKAPVSRLVATPAAVSFGSVHLGTRATRTIVITNAGNLPSTLANASGPEGPFGTQAQVPVGLPVNPGYQIRMPVTFTPSSTGRVSTRYQVRWRDAAGRHTLTVPVIGTGVAAISGHHAVPPPGGGWTLNGSAAMSGQRLRLTGARRLQAGSAVYAVPVAPSGLTARFTATLGGDGGMTLGLLSAQTSSPSSLGGRGGLFGFGGLGGVAITLATGRFAGDPSGNFAGIAVSKPGGGLRYLATTTRIPNLSSGSHPVRVAVRGSRVWLYLDGKAVLSAGTTTAQMPGQVLVGFTGGTGPSAGSQAVSSVTVSAGGRTLPPPGGGWSFNGSAQMRGSATELTAAAPSEAGSAVYPVAVPTSGLTVTFTAWLSGGGRNGGDGLTFAMLDPATSASASVGGRGGQLGFGGLGGVAIGLDTDPIQYGGRYSVVLATGSAGSSLTVAQQAGVVPPLRPGPDRVTVQVVPNGGTDVVTVWVDGERVILADVGTLPPTALLAFTGSTSERTDVHVVRDVAILAAG